MNLDLEDKLALVTASSGGIGKEIAATLAREGATVIVNGRTAAGVEAAIADIRARVPGARLEPLAADNGTAEGAAETIRRFPAVDILVNNLGIYENVGFFDETDEDWQRVFEINVMSGVRLSRHYLAGMLAIGFGADDYVVRLAVGCASCTVSASVHGGLTPRGLTLTRPAD